MRQSLYAIVDLTTDACPSELRPTLSDKANFCVGLARFMQDFSDEYGYIPRSFRVANDPNDRQPGEQAINLRDDLSEAPGALAYHQNVNGIPDIEVGCSLFQSVLTGQESIMCGISHEVAENELDPGANQWVDRQDATGMSDAKEACDFVQNTSYDVILDSGSVVTLSNFVLQTFWIPGSEGPWDHIGYMASQYDVAYGYGIQEPTPTQTIQIGGVKAEQARHAYGAHMVGMIRQEHIERKRHAYSRSRRRGLWFPPLSSP